ncbi:aldehyde dehydrogenase family protein [Jatrophihabitans sp.]|uniref:aldehyde dehydrogenase family protein n=1 Tax=Jatrophihabitans sp. TaxID=1932789 RepID=UPI0030C67F6C|nr:aldA 1 [Jatrophihabitans sp.]
MSVVQLETEDLPDRILAGATWLHAASGGDFPHVNPATGRVQRSVPLAGAAEIGDAVGAARVALPSWRDVGGAGRRRALSNLADLVRRDRDGLAAVTTAEVGIPISMAPFSVDFAADWIEESARWADRLGGEVLPSAPGDLIYTQADPLGVVGALTTWNGPIAAFAMAVAPALAAGCTVVVKPSELAPFGALRIAQLCAEAGIPPGVVSVLPGRAEAGEALVGHPGIDKVVFTGSPPTARLIAAACAQHLTPTLFELGGKSAVIVCADADLDRVVSSVLGLSFAAGQSCTLGSRLVVHRSVVGELTDRLVAAFESLRQGNPADPATMLGPVINDAACERILGLIDRARGYGRVVTGGERRGGELAEGFFIAPTLVDRIDNSSELARTEAFGPLVGLLEYGDDAEAVRIANDSEYGLAGYVFTADASRAHRLAAQFDVGSVTVNGGTVPISAQAPFGGRKSSGHGKQGGLAGVLEFTSTKSIQIVS